MVKTDNMIFVFGSNLLGVHGAGAAKFANERRHAARGIGHGRTGQAYALPTKAHPGDKHSLPIEDIKTYVDEFIAYAYARRNLQFQVTCVGCGLAGLTHEQVAPMFRPKELGGELPNLWFDTLWERFLGPKVNYWGTF